MRSLLYNIIVTFRKSIGMIHSVDICDPFWHNESEVAESRTEIWASEVGIGSKDAKRLFSIFSILDISRFISQNFKPQPPPQVPQTEL